MDKLERDGVKVVDVVDDDKIDEVDDDMDTGELTCIVIRGSEEDNGVNGDNGGIVSSDKVKSILKGG